MADARRIAIGLPVDRSTNSIPAITSFSLNQTTDALEIICQAPEAATITRLGCRLTSITGTTPTYRISAQGVNSSGDPDGTIKGATNNALKTFSPSGLGWGAAEWHWLTLDESFNVTRGEQFTIVIDYSSGTVDGSNFAAFGSAITNVTQNGYPHHTHNNAATRSDQAEATIYGFGSVSKAYGRPFETIVNQTVTTATTPDEQAIKFTFPADWGATFKVLGIRVSMQPGGGSGETFDVILYDTDGTTPLQSVNFPVNNFAGSNRMSMFYFDEATLSTLTFGSSYYLSIKPLVSASLIITYIACDAADDLEAWPGGTTFIHNERTDAGAWSAVDGQRMVAEIIIEDLTEPSASTVYVPTSSMICTGAAQRIAAY